MENLILPENVSSIGIKSVKYLQLLEDWELGIILWYSPRKLKSSKGQGVPGVLLKHPRPNNRV